jgi:hypothetical protein
MFGDKNNTVVMYASVICVGRNYWTITGVLGKSQLIHD